MNDPASENGQSVNGVTWRLRQFEVRNVKVLNGPIVLELADAQGLTLASMSIPFEKINELLRPFISTFVQLQLDGSASLDSEICVPTPASSTATDILQLVSQAVSPGMLEDEPEAAQMLAKFRDRLLKSLEQVEQAIASLPKD
jgi:hypothetical protein